jgi:hypothetical protein
MQALKSVIHLIKQLFTYPIALPLLTVIWLLFVFHSYLPEFSFLHYPLDFYLRRTGVYDIVLVLWFAGATYCVGKRLLRLLGVQAAPGAEEGVLSICLGLASYSLAALALSLIHGLYRPVAYVLLLIPAILWHAEFHQFFQNLRRALFAKGDGETWSVAVVTGWFVKFYIAASLGVILLSALGPSFEYDDLTYHLAGPKNFALHHRLVPLPDVPHLFFPKNIEMLYTLGLLLHSDVTAKLLHFLMGTAVMVAVFAFATRFLTRSSGMIAVAILASSPLLIWEMRTAHLDLGLTLFIFAGVYAVVVWMQTNENRWFWLACLCLAFSMGIKYWAFLALGVAVLLVFLVRLRRSSALSPAFTSALKLGFFSSLGLLPWGLVNLYYTGNPLFPLLNGVFHSPYWTTEQTEMALREMYAGGIRITFSNMWDLFRLPWAMLTDTQGVFKGNIGPWYVMFLPVLLFFPRMGSRLGFLFSFSVIYYAGWAIFAPLPRFLLPALPGFALAAAFAFTNLFQRIQAFRRSLAFAAAVLPGILAVLASPFFERYGTWSRYGFPPTDTIDFRYLTGQESRAELLNRYYPEYDAIQFINKLPAPRKVFYEHAVPDGFYLNGTAAYLYSAFGPELYRKGAAYIHDVLRRNGVTHVLVRQNGEQPSPIGSRESEFTRLYLRKIYQRNAFIVYELLANSVEQEAVRYDFLEHLAEARELPKPSGRQTSLAPKEFAVGDDPRYSMVIVPPSEVAFSLRIPGKASLSFAASRGNQGCHEKGVFQVWIELSGTGRRLAYELNLDGNEDRKWIENRVDLAGYANGNATIIFKNDEKLGCTDYYWADPVLVAPNNATPSLSVSEEPHVSLAVSKGRVFPRQVLLGGSIEVSFSGPDLTSETYFDILYREPGNSTDQPVFKKLRSVR